MRPEVMLIIIGAGLATYVTRFPLMILSESRELPPWLIKMMRFIAPTVLTALIIPLIFLKNGQIDISLSNRYIPSAVITAVVAYFTKNMLLSVLTGIAVIGAMMFFV